MHSLSHRAFLEQPAIQAQRQQPFAESGIHSICCKQRKGLSSSSFTQ
jgi:hypothetical protein